MSARFLRRLGSSLVVASALIAGGDAANANIVTTFQSVVFDGTNYDWTYSVRLDQSQTVDTTQGSNFLTIYDFGINTLQSTTGLLSLDFQYSTSFTNTAANNTTPTDSASILNVRFTANDGTVIAPGTFLGTFTLESPFGPDFRVVSFDGQAFLTSIPFGVQGNIGTTVAPVPGPIAGMGVPGLIVACAGLIALARRRRTSTLTA